MHRLGMSLGSFDLLDADESNPHGHFEAAPVVQLNRELQSAALGFDGDFPREDSVLRRLVASGGQWPSGQAYSQAQLEEGKGLIEQLLASGRVCGFKDPRTALTWPFWERVLGEFPGLRVVALAVLRSPHEIAMSMFRRSQGDCSYGDALDLTAVHYRRVKEILDSWRGDRAVLQFEPQTLAQQGPRAAAACGLPWDDSAIAEIYDSKCRHHAPAVVAHAAQALYEQLCGSAASIDTDNERTLNADMAMREQLLQRRCANLKLHFESCNAKLHAMTGRLLALEAEKASWDEYRRTRGWAVLQTVWRIKRALLPHK